MKVANGPRFSVPGLTNGLNRIEGVQAGILNTAPEKKLDAAEAEAYDFPFFPRYGRIANLPEPFNRPDLVVFHGVYKQRYLPLWWEVRIRRIPYVVTPRVSLTREAQDQSTWKKRVANTLFINHFIRRAAAIHYLTKREMEESVQFGGNCFVVGNGIPVPESPKRDGKNGNHMIFIGRYDIRHKGLDVLMLAIGHIKDAMLKRGLTIDLYGSRNKERQMLQQQSEVNGLDEVLTVHGPVYGKMKEEALLRSDLFIATSRFEGHPMAVLEAMSQGVAVLATPGTNMAKEIEETETGWAVDLDFREVGETILQAFEDKEELAHRGQKARELIVEKYTWDKIAEKTLEQYENLLSMRKEVNNR
jgi:glycosyltransferase involved in cell wall biosynthesis